MDRKPRKGIKEYEWHSDGKGDKLPAARKDRCREFNLALEPAVREAYTPIRTMGARGGNKVSNSLSGGGQQISEVICRGGAGRIAAKKNYKS